METSRTDKRTIDIGWRTRHAPIPWAIQLTRILTIGVYGFTPENFVARLNEAGADVLWDIRARRGVRGSQYAFANKTRLIQLLADNGIDYAHLPELAPPPEVRALEQQKDREDSVAKRSRRELSQPFRYAYHEQCLALWNALQALRLHSPQARAIALLCVEAEPEACHRSLVATKMAGALGTNARHLRP